MRTVRSTPVPAHAVSLPPHAIFSIEADDTQNRLPRPCGGLLLDIVNAALEAGQFRPHPSSLVAAGPSTEHSRSCPSQSQKSTSRNGPLPGG